MSLEESLKENTASIRDLIRALEQDNNLVRAVDKAQEQQTVTTPPEAAPAKLPEKPAEKTVAKPAITPADIQKAATMVVKEKGRPAVDPVLEKYKLDRFVDAKPEIFEEIYADLVELRGAK